MKSYHIWCLNTKFAGSKPLKCKDVLCYFSGLTVNWIYLGFYLCFRRCLLFFWIKIWNEKPFINVLVVFFDTFVAFPRCFCRLFWSILKFVVTFLNIFVTLTFVISFFFFLNICVTLKLFSLRHFLSHLCSFINKIDKNTQIQWK